MTTIDAARDIRDQLRAHGEPAPWSECMRWASDCRQEAIEHAERQRHEWFERRREELRCEAWKEKLRLASLITEVRHDAVNGREGGWAVEWCGPTKPKEDAA